MTRSSSSNGGIRPQAESGLRSTSSTSTAPSSACDTSAVSSLTSLPARARSRRCPYSSPKRRNPDSSATSEFLRSRVRVFSVATAAKLPRELISDTSLTLKCRTLRSAAYNTPKVSAPKANGAAMIARGPSERTISSRTGEWRTLSSAR